MLKLWCRSVGVVLLLLATDAIADDETLTLLNRRGLLAGEPVDVIALLDGARPAPV